MLERNYRSHPSITWFSSQQFYGGALTAAFDASKFSRPRGMYFPNDQRTVFIHVDGSEHRDHAGSWENQLEADVVIDVCEKMVRQNGWVKAKDLNSQKVAVLSAYRAQCTLINAGIRHLGLVCVTVDSIQGSERDIVILSAVRSNRKSAVGFMCDYRRVNVLLTRARLGTILVGNADTLYSCMDILFFTGH